MGKHLDVNPPPLAEYAFACCRGKDAEIAEIKASAPVWNLDKDTISDWYDEIADAVIRKRVEAGLCPECRVPEDEHAPECSVKEEVNFHEDIGDMSRERIAELEKEQVEYMNALQKARGEQKDAVCSRDIEKLLLLESQSRIDKAVQRLDRENTIGFICETNEVGQYRLVNGSVASIAITEWHNDYINALDEMRLKIARDILTGEHKYYEPDQMIIEDFPDDFTADSTAPPQPTREAELLEIIERAVKAFPDDAPFGFPKYRDCVNEARYILAEAKGKEQADAER